MLACVDQSYHEQLNQTCPSQCILHICYAATDNQYIMQFPTAGKLYFLCFRVQEALKALTTTDAPQAFIDAAERAFSERWEMLHTPLHAAAYALDPEFWKEDMYALPEVMAGVDIMINRVSSDFDKAKTASRQFTDFRRKKGPFAHELAVANACSMPAWEWWQRYGYGLPELQKVAMRVLGQVVSATAAERNWSVFGHLHTATRNRLTAERATDLTYCFSSLRLRDNLNDPEREEFAPNFD